jgi:nitrate reductase gamma subunit
MRLFLEPVPQVIGILETLDGFFQVGAPVLYITDLIFLGAVTFLFLRRVIIPQVRYISLASDYFPLFLIFGIGLSGVLMRYFFKTDIVGVKELTMGLITFTPVIPQGIDIIFYIHLFLVSILLLYFPMSKLMHMAGVFLSPTRNLANNNRAVRHGACSPQTTANAGVRRRRGEHARAVVRDDGGGSAYRHRHRDRDRDRVREKKNRLGRG